MRTRRGMCYPREETNGWWKETKRERGYGGEQEVSGRKRPRLAGKNDCDLFDGLPDDLVLSILAKLSSTASCPADLINVLLTCKRFNGLGLHSLVLSRASSKVFAVKADKWCDSSHRFFKLCADAGNVEASYTLGMIRFYCLENRGSGASLMAKAAINSHAPALYSLAVIQFNGSGGSKNDKDLRAGVALCARAAFLGHIDALRELGHCLQDGYGVRQNVAEGRRYLVQANARELAAVLSPAAASVLSSPAAASLLSTRSVLAWNPQHGGDNNHIINVNNNHPDPAVRAAAGAAGCPLLSDFGCNVPAPEAHPANRFLSEWFASRGGVPGSGLRMCSHAGCGRSETRKHEFRRCSVCGTVNYCSRACQALDWKLRHKVECAPLERWIDEDGGDGLENDGVGDGNDDVIMAES